VSLEDLPNVSHRLFEHVRGHGRNCRRRAARPFNSIRVCSGGATWPLSATGACGFVSARWFGEPNTSSAEGADRSRRGSGSRRFIRVVSNAPGSRASSPAPLGHFASITGFIAGALSELGSRPLGHEPASLALRAISNSAVFCPASSLRGSGAPPHAYRLPKLLRQDAPLAERLKE
jgi:hypothetical protein